MERLTGWAPSKLSRTLNLGAGRQRAVRSDATERARKRRELLPTAKEAAQLARVLRAAPATQERIVALAAQARDEREAVIGADVALVEPGETQERWARFEAASTEVRVFHPILVPGLLQTENYMRSMFRSLDGMTDDQVERAVAARLRRERQSRDRRCIMLAPESVLWWGIPGPRVMAELCEHIAGLATSRPAWTIGFIPGGAPGGEPPLSLYPTNGFDIFDDRLLTVGTTVRNIQAVNTTEIDNHLAMFDRLMALAVQGDNARALLSGIAADYRNRGER